MALKITGMFRSQRSQDIAHRWEGNPLITISDLDFKCSDVHNAGIIEFQDQVLMLLTIEDLSGRRALHLARASKGGLFKVEKEPFLRPSADPKYRQHELRGVLDPRITFLDDTYYIVYNALGIHGYRLALAKTDDFETVERLGFISEPDTKAGMLFPEKINGRYARLERPSHGYSIWVTYSDDLIHWGASELVMSPRGGFWDADRIGPGAVPLEIECGWLLIYYGAKNTSAGPIYRTGAAILDHEDPTKIVGRVGTPILSPRKKYERLGDVSNLVFATGAIIDQDNQLHIFYGAADSCICMAATSVQDIIENCIKSTEVGP